VKLRTIEAQGYGNRLPNGSYTGALGALHKGECDFIGIGKLGISL
jgi:hypothetical protein